MTFLALLALVAVTWALGRGFAARSLVEDDSVELRLVTGWIAGLLLLYLLLLGFHALGLAWRPVTLAPALLAAAAISGYLGRRPAPAREPAPGWGDGAALAAFGVFVLCTALLWNLHPDFIYHWGLKGEKFFLARGLDFDFLAAPGNGHVHPDYPNLLPSLFAVTAILGGRFDEAATALWSALFFALLVLAARDLLRRLGVSAFARQAGTAAVALALAMFGVGYLQAGGADWLIALAVLAGAALLTARPGPALDARIGVVAAFAAASKIEGIALAIGLLALHLLRRWRHGCRNGRLPWVLVRAALPVAIVTGVWLWQVSAHGLFQATNTGGFDPRAIGVVLPALWRSLWTVNWHGLTLCLLALPLFLLDRNLRWPAALCCWQLAFYVYAYLSASVDPRVWVETSAARLYFHLVPAALALLVAAVDRPSPLRERGRETDPDHSPV